MISVTQFRDKLIQILNEFIDRDSSSIVCPYLEPAPLHMELVNDALIVKTTVLKLPRHPSKIALRYWTQKQSFSNPRITTNEFDCYFRSSTSLDGQCKDPEYPLTMAGYQFLQNIPFLQGSRFLFSLVLETAVNNGPPTQQGAKHVRTKKLTIDWTSTKRNFMSIYDLITLFAPDFNPTTLKDTDFKCIGYYLDDDNQHYFPVIEIGTGIEHISRYVM
jgi:hypothetical protein